MPDCPDCGREFGSKSALTQHVNKQHGQDPLTKLRASIPGSPRPGGVFDARPLKASPSGVPCIDYAIGIGGVPRGAIVEVFGPPAAGKTLVALTFSAYAQQTGGRAGYMDAEEALTETFIGLVPGLDGKALEYAMRSQIGDGSGEDILETSRKFIRSDQYDVWTVDSVHACTPREMLGRPIGDPQANAALARLFSMAMQIIEHEIRSTNTVAVFVNHVKDKPGVQFGRNWAKPGGSALDYYASVQLHVKKGRSYLRKGDDRQFGHQVKVKVLKNKVAAPFASAEFDLFYAPGVIKADPRQGVVERPVMPGVDIPSCWFGVLKESGRVRGIGGRYHDEQTGEALGSEPEVLEMLKDPTSGISRAAYEIVYPTKYRPVEAA